MSSILPLIFSLILLVSCGKHSQKTTGNNGNAHSQQIISETLTTDILNENVTNLEAYLAKGGDLEAELKNGRTLFTEACHWMKFKVIGFLVLNKVDPARKDRFGKSALDYANDDIQIKRALFPELVIEQKKNLFLAAKKNQMTELKKLLEENPPLNFVLVSEEIGTEMIGFEGETFLTFCIKSKLENILRLVAQPKYALDVNQKNIHNETPLKIAKELKYTNIEKLLIKLGAVE